MSEPLSQVVGGRYDLPADSEGTEKSSGGARLGGYNKNVGADLEEMSAPTSQSTRGCGAGVDQQGSDLCAAAAVPSTGIRRTAGRLRRAAGTLRLRRPARRRDRGWRGSIRASASATRARTGLRRTAATATVSGSSLRREIGQRLGTFLDRIAHLVERVLRRAAARHELGQCRDRYRTALARRGVGNRRQHGFADP